VVCNREIIGEAAKQISSHVRDRHPQVAWRRYVPSFASG
jgi:uncharacterized protein with HEPN domain